MANWMWVTCFEIEGWEIQWFNSLRTVISLRDQGWRHGILTAPRKINGFHIIWIHHNMLPMRNLQVNAFFTLLSWCFPPARWMQDFVQKILCPFVWNYYGEISPFILELCIFIVFIYGLHFLLGGWWVRFMKGFCLGGRAGRVALGAGCRCLWIRPRVETNS